MIVRQNQLGGGEAVNGCGQVAIANLLGLPFEQVREEFDETGAVASGRTHGTHGRDMSAVLYRFGYTIKRTYFRRAKRVTKESLAGIGILMVKIPWRNSYHYVAFADGIVQDSDRFTEGEQRSVKNIFRIERRHDD